MTPKRKGKWSEEEDQLLIQVQHCLVHRTMQSGMYITLHVLATAANIVRHVERFIVMAQLIHCSGKF